MLVFWAIGFLLLALWGYKDSFLYLNQLNTPFLNRLMPHLTHLGDGVLLSAVFAMLVYRKDPGLVLTMIINMLLLMVVIGVAKRYIFMGWDRPPIVFRDLVSINYLSMQGERYHSFPSGHSAAIAAMMAIFSYHFSRFSGYFWALAAIIIAYTRLYIGVHFWGDVLVGTCIGVALSLGALSLIYPKISHWVGRLSDKKRTFLSIFLLMNGLLGLVATIWRLYPNIFS